MLRLGHRGDLWRRRIFGPKSWQRWQTIQDISIWRAIDHLIRDLKFLPILERSTRERPGYKAGHTHLTNSCVVYHSHHQLPRPTHTGICIHTGDPDAPTAQLGVRKTGKIDGEGWAQRKHATRQLPDLLHPGERASAEYESEIQDVGVRQVPIHTSVIPSRRRMSRERAVPFPGPPLGYPSKRSPRGRRKFPCASPSLVFVHAPESSACSPLIYQMNTITMHARSLLNPRADVWQQNSHIRG